MKERMKHIFHVVCRMPMFWVFVLLMIVYMPSALLAPAENDSVVVCTGVGVDKADEGIELSILTLIPQNSLTFADSYRLVSAKGQNIALATNELVNYLGKRVDLAHAAYVIFGEELASDGIKTIIEDLVRSNDIGMNAIVMTTNVTAKEMFETTKQFDTNSGEKVKDILYNNKRNLMDINTSIDKFYNTYLTPSSCSITNKLNLVEGQGEGVEASNQSSGSGGGENAAASESEQAKPTKKVSNDGSCSVFKNARRVLDLTAEQTQAINLVDPKSFEGKFVINDYITEDGNPLDVSFDILDKIVKTEAKIEKNHAKITYNINFRLDVLGVESEADDPVDKIPQKSFDDTQMQHRIADKYKTAFFGVLDVLTADDLDCIGVNDILKRSSPKKYREFLQSLGENANILENVDIKVNISIAIK